MRHPIDESEFLNPPLLLLAKILAQIKALDPDYPPGPARFIAERLIAAGYDEVPNQIHAQPLFEYLLGFRFSWALIDRQPVPRSELKDLSPNRLNRRYVWSGPQMLKVAKWAYLTGDFKPIMRDGSNPKLNKPVSRTIGNGKHFEYGFRAATHCL